MENWTGSLMRLTPSSNDGTNPCTTSSTVYCLTGITSAAPSFGPAANHHYLRINALEDLSQPGQFYLDVCPSTNCSGGVQENSFVLHYLARPGEDPNTDSVIVPQVNLLMSATNLSNVTFQGLTFSHDNYVVPAAGQAATSFSSNIAAAMSMVGVSGITFDNDTWSHMGRWAWEFKGASTSNTVQNFICTDVGVGCGRIGVPPSGGDTEGTVPSFNTVNNGIVAGGMRILPGGPGTGVSIGNAHHNTVSHVLLDDWYNTGMELGESMGYDLASLAHDNTITQNVISNIGEGVTSDLGGIHVASGAATGNVLSYNVVHDVTEDSDPPGYNGECLYVDQSSSYVTVVGNLVYRCSEAGILLNSASDGAGRGNILAGNILAGGNEGAIKHTTNNGFLDLTATHNIFFMDGGNVHGGPQFAHNNVTPGMQWYCQGGSCSDYFAFDYNTYFNPAVDLNTSTPWYTVNSGGTATWTSWTGWKALIEDTHSTIANPGFVGPSFAQGDNYAFSGNPPSGFTVVDYTQSGPTGLAMPAAVPHAFPLSLWPTMASVSPTSGAPGSIVTVTGKSFQPGALVTFGSTAAVTTFVNSTQLTAVIPAVTGTMSVTVTNPNTKSDSLANVFTAAAAGSQLSYASRTDIIYTTPPATAPAALVGLNGLNASVVDALNDPALHPGAPGNRLIRVTDASLSGAGSTWTSTSSAGYHVWNLNNDVFIGHVQPGGSAAFFAWDAVNKKAIYKGHMSATATLPSAPGDSFGFGWLPADAYSWYGVGAVIGGVQTFNRYTLDPASPAWTCPSATPPGNCGASNDVGPAVTAQVLFSPTNTSVCPGIPANRWQSIGDADKSFDGNRLVVNFWYQQDQGSVTAIYDRSLNACRWYDSRTGQIGGNWPSAPVGMAQCGGQVGTVSTSCATGKSIPAPPVSPNAIASTGSLNAAHVYKVGWSLTEGTVGETKLSATTTVTGSTGYSVAPPPQPVLTVTSAASALKASGWNLYACDQTAEGSGCTPHLQGYLSQPIIDSTASRCNSNCTANSTIRYWVVAENGTQNSVYSHYIDLPWAGSGAVNETVCFAPVTGATVYSLLRDRIDAVVKNSVTAITCPTNGAELALTDSSASVSGFWANETNQIAATANWASYNGVSSATENQSICEPNTTGSADPCTGTAGVRFHASGIDESGAWAHIGGAVNQPTQYSTSSTGIPEDWYIAGLQVTGNLAPPNHNYALNISQALPGHDVTGFAETFQDNPNSTMHFERFKQYSTDAQVEDASSYFIGCCGGSGANNDSTYDKHFSYIPNSSYPTVQQPIYMSSEVNSERNFQASPNAWRGEIIAASTDPAIPTTWRFCYNYTSGSVYNLGTSFWGSSRGNISSDGKWFLFTSDLQANSLGHQGQADVGVGSISGTASCAPGWGSITSISEVGTTATATTSYNHNFVVGDKVTITADPIAGYNITNATITAVTATTFSYTAGSPGLGTDSSGVGQFLVGSPTNACRNDLFICELK